MIHARSQLYRQLQEFFETYLRPICAWSAVEHLPAERVEAVKGRSRFPFGKQREMVSVRFGLFDLTVWSSQEAPPLGKIAASGPGGEAVEMNSLDPTAWRAVAEFILQKQEHESHV